MGVDIGGTNIKMGAVDYKGNILANLKVPTQASLAAEAILDRLVHYIRDLIGSISGYRLTAIGFGIPGAIRFHNGVVTQAPNIPAWDGLPIRQMLQERLQLPCYIENDANAIALGEAWMGAARGYNHVCCLTLGTGVGGGVIIDGELLRGADGMAAELGHISVQADGARCNCGSYGCLETFASATGILRILSQLLQEKPSSLAALSGSQLTTEIVYRHAVQGDAVAREVLEIAGRGLGVGMASLINMFNPEIMVIGGGVAAAWDVLMPPAMKSMYERAFKAPAARANVARAEKEDEAGIYGSAYVAWNSIQRGDAGPSKERSLTPWGFWQVLEEGKDYKVKRLYIHPGHRISYQKHQHREETWMIAAGEALVILNGQEYRLSAGQTIHIPKTALHRIGNTGNAPLVFFEVQRGTYFGEDDITRLEDDYSRN